MLMPSEDIKDMLEEDVSLGLTFQTNLFIGREPDIPNSVVTIYDTPGGVPRTTLGGNSQVVYSYPSVQIRVRDANYVTAYNLARGIINSLHTKHHGESYNGALYIMIQSGGEPISLGYTEKGLALFVVNFNLQRKEA